MAKIFVVSLSDAERLLLRHTIKTGTASARSVTRAPQNCTGAPLTERDEKS